MSEFAMAVVMETTVFCVVILNRPVDVDRLADDTGAFVFVKIKAEFPSKFL
jgi:hypothetical protein